MHLGDVILAYDTIARGNPLGFFGMVHVLEGTSVALALMAADRIQSGLGLPDAAFSYLRSHGTLDQQHTAHFEQLVDRLDDPADQAALLGRVVGTEFEEPMKAAVAASQALKLAREARVAALAFSASYMTQTAALAAANRFKFAGAVDPNHGARGGLVLRHEGVTHVLEGDPAQQLEAFGLQGHLRVRLLAELDDHEGLDLVLQPVLEAQPLARGVGRELVAQQRALDEGEPQSAQAQERVRLDRLPGGLGGHKWADRRVLAALADRLI